MDSKVEMYSRIQATKELHSLSKTSVLLFRDLPFVTNLSKFYDDDTLNSIYNDSLQSRKNEYSNRNNQETVKYTPQEKDFDMHENRVNPSDSNGIDGRTALVGESGLNVENKPQREYKRFDSDVIEDMQRQMHISDPLKDKSMDEITPEDLDRMITPEHKESVLRLRELLDD
jgi:hypothetical protein